MSSRKPWVWFLVLVLGMKYLRSLGRRVVRKFTGRKPDGFDAAIPRLIPKTVWIFWDSGEEDAPEIVRMCIASWRARNPTWTVRVLDKTTASRIADMPPLPAEAPIQTFADLLRCRLLNEHGGVWADATSFCVRPLDHWLPIVAQRGFFAFVWKRNERWFTWPGYFRELANWFLASEPGGTIISHWDRYGLSYWSGRRRAHVYFWPHVLFETLLYLRPAFRRAYRDMPKIGCLGPHLVHDGVLRGRDSDRITRIIADGAAPVQKLSWKWTDAQLALARALLFGPGAEKLSQAEIIARLKA